MSAEGQIVEQGGAILIIYVIKVVVSYSLQTTVKVYVNIPA
jgi:hypothetical protein